MREIPSFWENSSLVNEEALIKLIRHILQALQWNNGSRQQSSRNQNLIMGGRGCHTCPHSSVWASLQGRQPERLASRRETAESTEYPPRGKKSCLQTEPESNWTPRSLYHPLCFCVCLKFFIYKVLRTRCWGCSWKPLLHPLLQILLICISSLSSLNIFTIQNSWVFLWWLRSSFQA